MESALVARSPLLSRPELSGSGAHDRIDETAAKRFHQSGLLLRAAIEYVIATQDNVGINMPDDDRSDSRRSFYAAALSGSTEGAGAVIFGRRNFATAKRKEKYEIGMPTR